MKPATRNGCTTMFTYMKNAVNVPTVIAPDKHEAAAVAEDDDRADRGERRHPRGHQRVDLRLPVERVGVALVGHARNDGSRSLPAPSPEWCGCRTGSPARACRDRTCGPARRATKRPSRATRTTRRRRRTAAAAGSAAVSIGDRYNMKLKPTTVANTNTTSRMRAHGDEALDQADVGDGARHHVADGELARRTARPDAAVGRTAARAGRMRRSGRRGERECAPESRRGIARRRPLQCRPPAISTSPEPAAIVSMPS